MQSDDICLRCGACCAFFRVSFYWGETDQYHGGTVPAELTEKVTNFYNCMNGTNRSHPRCTALKGNIGAGVSCSIYADRPSPCREFGIQFKDGVNRLDPEDRDRCNRARAAWNLSPLQQGEQDTAVKHKGSTHFPLITPKQNQKKPAGGVHHPAHPVHPAHGQSHL